jgi:subtilisin family serine protease
MPVSVCGFLALLALVWACEAGSRQRGESEDQVADGVPLSAVTRRDSVRPADDKVSAALREIGYFPADTQLSFVVEMRDQLEPRKLAAQLDVRARTRRERRSLAVALARRVGDASQRRLRPTLDSLAARGAIGAYRSITVANWMVVRGSPDAVRLLARHPDVAAIRAGRAAEPRDDTGGSRGRRASRREGRRPAQRSRRGGESLRPWAPAAIGADSAWRLGLTGEGTVVGIIDAGASGAHEQLRQNFRGGAASWYDPQGATASPNDALAGHGTGILSIAVGRAPVAGDSIGVAPGARWVACVGLPEGRYDPVSMIECADWIFNIAQPDILINPWSIADGACDRSLEVIVNAWRAAEILPVFAAGNEGPASGSGGSPANYVDLYPGSAVALSVGGVRRDRRVFERSSRGPNRCNGSVYPVVVAPAEDITAGYPLSPTMYVRASGTSYAAGLVAGAAALLLERHPEATISELEAALRSGARDLGRRGAEHDFGFGMLDVPRAIAALDLTRGPPTRGSADVRADRK